MNTDKERRQAERRPLETQVEFYVDASIINAMSLDISETGLRFETHEPIKICLRIEVEGKLMERVAQIVWASRKPDGSTALGLEFILDEGADTF